MKKKNLATAMAAAMMFGGVAPVVAHADEKAPVEVKNAEVTPDQSQDIAKKENVVDVPLANGKNVEVKEYKDIYKNNGTLETKDDELALKDNQEVLYAEGVIGKTLNTTNAQYIVATKMTDEEMKKQAEDIKVAKTNYEDYLANIAALKNLTYTKDGKTEKVYKEDVKNEVIKDGDKIARTRQVITLTNVAPEVNGFAKEAKFTFKNIKMDSKLENEKEEGLKTFGTVLEGKGYPVKDNTVTLNVADKAGVAQLNKVAYELSHTYNSNNTETKSDEVYENGQINKIITVTEKGTKNEVGQIVLQGYDKFKANKFEGFVNISEIKDLNSLEKPELSWAKEAVMDALYNGQLKGYEDNTLKLNGNVTRAEFARMLVQLRGESVKEADLKENFSDVNPSDWFYKDVATLASLGIVKGDGNGTFRPDDTITRQEAAVMIAKAINGGADVDRFNEKTGKAIDTDTIFTDDESIAIWADGAVNALNKEGVINGYNEGKNKLSFKPENKITRAESIVMLNNSKACQSVANHVEKQ